MNLKWSLASLAIAVLSLAPSCGLGTAGLVAGAGNGGGGGSTPTITSFEVLNPKVSPATLRLEASQAVLVELFYARPGVGTAAMMELSGPGVSGNQVQLPSGATDLAWNFEAELGGPEFVADVDLFARHPNGASISGGTLHLGMGNDPPVMLLVEPMPTDPANPGESSGNVEVRLGVSDSSSDVVAIEMEWRRASDAPDAWQLATAAGVFPTGVETNTTGVELSFFWNTNVDLADGDDDVFLRAIADDGTLDPNNDPIGVSAPLESGLLHIDNNDEPIVQLFNDLVISNPDERRGIPIPFRVVDDEDDPVEVIFQWRREGEGFPGLPTDDMAALDALLANPELRREHHVCTPYPRFAQGRVVPLGATTVRLPELASSEAWILAHEVEGRTLDLMRPSPFPAPITPTWSANPLEGPIAALPLGDGLTALVLDASGGSWRLREIELATGNILPEAGSVITSGSGMPSALCLERGEAAVLVASEFGGTWQVERVDLASGVVVELALSDGSESGPVHGLASIGTSAAVFTAGAALFHVDYRDGQTPQLGRLLGDLASPRGVAVDLLRPDHLFVAEHDADRVLDVELDSRGRQPIVVTAESLLPGSLGHPGALAFDRERKHLLVVTDQEGGGRGLTGLALGARGMNVAYAFGPPFAGDLASVASGPAGLLLFAAPVQDELLVGGGIEQRRTIVAYEPSGQSATVDRPFVPAVQPASDWRIVLEPQLRASSDGADGSFIWDSGADVPGGGPAFLRALARDDEAGIASEGQAEKNVAAALDVEPLTITSALLDSPNSVAAGDLDGDGDLDLVSANSHHLQQSTNTLTVFFQNSPGSFDRTPLVLGSPATTPNVRAVNIADLDGDAKLDILARVGDNLAIFYQKALGGFDPTPTFVANAGSGVADLDGDGDLDLFGGGSTLRVSFQVGPKTFGPTLSLDLPAGFVSNSVAAADLDGDGDLDLASANTDYSNNAGNITVFFQEGLGVFSSPLVIEPRGEILVSVAAADLDGDGDSDLAVAAAGNFNENNNLMVFFQDSPGNFGSRPLVLSSQGLAVCPTFVTAADLDGDGDQDLIGLDECSYGLTLFFQDSPGSFESTVILPVVVAGNGPLSVAAADIEGDGDQDLVSADYSGDSLTIFLQSSAGFFERVPFAPLTNTPLNWVAADMNGDGSQDLIGTGPTELVWIYFHQKEPRSFAPAPLAIPGAGPAVAADLNGDGSQDLVTNGPFSLTLFLQDSLGGFGPPLALGGSTTPCPAAVAAADLDGDGDLDLASSNSCLDGNGSGSNVTVFFQSAPGVFDSTPLTLGGLPTTISPSSIVAADLDGDGAQDLAAAGQDLYVFFQIPEGFDPDPLILVLPHGAGVPGVDLAAGDLDGDGDLDLVTSNSSADNLTVFFQESAGTFNPAPLVLGSSSTTALPASVSIADFDGDGDQDLASSNTLGVTVFLQEVPGSFSFHSGSTFNSQFPFPASATDLDGDGEQDLVSVNTILWGGQ